MTTKGTLGALLVGAICMLVSAAPASAAADLKQELVEQQEDTAKPVRNSEVPLGADAFEPKALADSDPRWIVGTTAYQTGTSCIGLDQYPGQTQIGAFTGYYGAADVSYPKVGDRFWGVIYVTAIGPGCGLGIHLVPTEIALPSGVQLAINPQSSDPNDKVRCYGYNSQGQPYGELTGGTWTHPDSSLNLSGKYCDATQVFQSANGIHLGQRLLAQGQSFEIIFPLRATKKLSGIAEPNNAARMTATLTTPGINMTIARPFQWVFVGDRPVEADCPGAGTTAASAITDTTAHTRNFMCNWYRSGKVSIEIGEAAASTYQASSQQYDVPNSAQAIYVDQDWNNLIPGTTYRWRLKFVDDRGTLSTTDDQTYFSQPKTFTTTGTRPANPPATTPGAGQGGSGDGASTSPPAGDGGGQQQSGGDQQQSQQQEQRQDQQQAIVDTVAPGLSATVGKLNLRDLLKKGLRATATCSEACTVQAQLQVDAKTAKKLKLGKKTVAIGKGKAAGSGKITVPVKLTAKAKKQLKRARSLKATLVLTATDSAGNAAKPVKRKLSLKR